MNPNQGRTYNFLFNLRTQQVETVHEVFKEEGELRITETYPCFRCAGTISYYKRDVCTNCNDAGFVKNTWRAS